MNTNYLLLSVSTATFGFLIWFAMSASLRLPKMFQIQFDINRPYMNRFLRRRILMFILYVLVPYVLIYDFNILGVTTLSELDINFFWNQRSTLWVVILVPVVIIVNFFISKTTPNLSEFPEIRLTRWTLKLYLLSAITWAFQIFAQEFLYRGMLLQSLRMCGLSDMMAIIISTGVYALTQYFQRSLVSITNILYGLLACYIVIDTNSLLPVFVIHLANALFAEWFAIWRHPEIGIAS